MIIKEPAKPGLYLHIPFCRHKCGYCDFYSVTDSKTMDAFVDTLCIELRNRSETAGQAEFDTIYLGGGTPSLLSGAQLGKILSTIHSSFRICPGTEITLEINPGTLVDSKMREFYDLGVNRLSIGAQSFNDRELEFLERIHSVHDIYRTVEAARHAGIERLALDLIFGLPKQSIESWRENLTRAVDLAPDHISAYNLTLERGTPFEHRWREGETMILGEEGSAEFFLETVNFLARSGYTAYEVSNYAKSADLVSRHNIKYWFHVPYLGFGPSAHSFWNNRRWKNVRDLNSYLKKMNAEENAVEEMEALSQNDLEFEHIMLGLRTYQGVNLRRFRSAFGYDFFKTYEGIIADILDSGKGLLQEGYFRLNVKGMLICDEIITRFYH